MGLNTVLCTSGHSKRISHLHFLRRLKGPLRMTVSLNTCSWKLYKVLERCQVLGRWQGGSWRFCTKMRGPLETKERENKKRY